MLALVRRLPSRRTRAEGSLRDEKGRSRYMKSRPMLRLSVEVQNQDIFA